MPLHTFHHQADIIKTIVNTKKFPTNQRLPYLYARVKKHAVISCQCRFVFSQVHQKRAVFQILGHDKYRPMFGAHTVKLHQILMLQLPVGVLFPNSSIWKQTIPKKWIGKYNPLTSWLWPRRWSRPRSSFLLSSFWWRLRFWRAICLVERRQIDRNLIPPTALIRKDQFPICRGWVRPLPESICHRQVAFSDGKPNRRCCVCFQHILKWNYFFFSLKTLSFTDDSWPTRQSSGSNVSPIRKIPTCCFVWCGNAWLVGSVCILKRIDCYQYGLKTRYAWLLDVMDGNG